MEQSFTPGPWHTSGNIVYAEDGFAVGNVITYHGQRQPDTKHNAALIAAAPDLYAALEFALACLQFANEHIDCSVEIDMARAALAKARGEA